MQPKQRVDVEAVPDDEARTKSGAAKTSTTIKQSESDTNTGTRRQAWDATRTPSDRALLDRDAAVYLKQSVSTPCLTSIVGADGPYLYASDGTRYLDFHGNSAHQIGYGHPRLVSALQAQLQELPFVPRRFTSDVSVRFAESLIEHAPKPADGRGPLERVLLTTGGSDAVEVALKLARVATGRHKTLSFWESFHGAGFGSSSVGGEQLFRGGPLGPMLSGAEHVPPIGCYRDHLGEGHRSDEPHRASCGRALAELIDYTLKVQGDVAALVAEPMRAVPQLAAPGFWQAVRKSCDETGTLLIFDEIPTGLGRTGEFSASTHEGVVPDLLVWGKGLGGGVLPVAAVLATAELDVAGDWALGHYTHEKNPMMSRAGLTTIEIIDDEGLVGESARKGSHVLERLRDLQSRCDIVGDTRGRGLMLGVDIVEPGTQDPDPGRAEAALYACLERGLSFKTTMGSVLTLAPALTIPDDELDRALDILEDAVLAAV